MRIARIRPLKFYSELFSLPRSVKLMCAVVLVYYIGWGIVQPFLPIYFKNILKTYTNVGIVTGILCIFSIFWTLFFGSIADKIPKKRILIATLLLYLPLSNFLLLLRSLFNFLVFRFYHAFVASAFWTVSESHVREHSPKGKTSEAMGLFDISYALPIIVGPIIGGILLSKIGFSFLYLISIFAVMAIIPLLFVKERKKKITLQEFKSDFRTEIRDFAKNKALVRITSIMFFTGFCFSFVLMLLPLFLQEAGANFLQIGIIYAVFFLPILFESYFSVVADRSGKKQIMLFGLFLAALVFFFLFFAKNIPTIFVLSFFLSFSFSVFQPALQGRATDLMPRRITGELTGVRRAVVLTGAGIGPIIAGIISDIFGFKWVFILGAAVFLALFYFVSRMKFDEIKTT